MGSLPSGTPRKPKFKLTIAIMGFPGGSEVKASACNAGDRENGQKAEKKEEGKVGKWWRRNVLGEKAVDYYCKH